MVKFTFFVSTPRGGHYNTHYAKSKKKAEYMVNQWNAELKGTNYSVSLKKVVDASNEKLPEGYTLW